MLNPELNRLSYGEQLTPPEGYEFDSGIATTYSLDLDALLSVPIALSFHETLDGDLINEKLAILEAIGQLKGRLKVFYQKGNIHIPSHFNRLYTLLEPCMHAIVPDGGEFSSFHPKVWLLRFISKSSPSQRANYCYRLIVLSRNLTLDRSWDVAVSVDGKVNKKKLKVVASESGLRFLKDLLELDKKFLPAREILNELDQIEWEPPDNFSHVQFLAGSKKYGLPLNFEHPLYDEMLVVSPFLQSSGGGIAALQWLEKTVVSGKRSLFSRASELNAIGSVKLANWDCYAMNELVVNGEERNEVYDSAAGERAKKQDLHAKLIVQSLGRKAWWHIGSANATAAALGGDGVSPSRNTETMLLLKGDVSKIGPEILRNQWLPINGCGLFELHQFQPLELDKDESAEILMRRVVHQLISAKWILKANLDESNKTFSLCLDVDLSDIKCDGLSIFVEQLALPGLRVLCARMIWQQVEMFNISSFIPIVIRINGAEIEKRLIIEAKLEFEGKDERHERILKDLVDTPEKVLNYLRLLLNFNGPKEKWITTGGHHVTSGDGELIFSDEPILEQLLIASSRYPEVLRRISRSLERLRKAKVEIPEEFGKIWVHFEKVMNE